jgi:hypothetical protein
MYSDGSPLLIDSMKKSKPNGQQDLENSRVLPQLVETFPNLENMRKFFLLKVSLEDPLLVKEMLKQQLL